MGTSKQIGDRPLRKKELLFRGRLLRGLSPTSIFITGTDTRVGKTIATAVLGALLQERGLDVGVMKPVQCAGNDAEFLVNFLNVSDSLTDVNPLFARTPVSPNVAFAREDTKVNVEKIIQSYKRIQAKHDITLVEGAGGLLVPLKKDYLIADLIVDLDLDVVIVARPGLGTINHTLLTIKQCREYGLNVKGVLFCQTQPAKDGISEQTNPKVIEEYGKTKVLGTIPYFSTVDYENIQVLCKDSIDVSSLLRNNPAPSKSLARWDKEYLWHPFTQMKDWIDDEPLIIDKAKGNYLIDTKNRKYFDGVSSLWVTVHGHRNKMIDEAIKTQLNKLDHSTLLGLSNTPAVELARKLVHITPEGLEKVFYSDNGSTAVEVAIKMAYQYWQNMGKTKKTKLVHLANSYHGDTLGSVSIGGIDVFHKVYKNLIFDTIEVDFPDCYRAPKGKKYPEYAFECLAKFEKFLEKKHQSIAAFVVEPLVQAAAGMIIWPKGILRKMSQLCKKYDVIFIVDEVATGFGRTGKMFACEHENVKPDIMCLAKGITGGYLPLAATLTTKKIYNGFLAEQKDFKTFFHGHTYTGNPLCCAAALANLQVFENKGVIKKLTPKIKYLEKKLAMFYNLRHVGHVRSLGFMVGIELVRNKATKKAYSWKETIGVRVCKEVRKHGVILRPLGHVIVLMPPLSTTIKEIDKLVDATYKSIEKVTERI